jgi:hypothetical protein
LRNSAGGEISTSAWVDIGLVSPAIERESSHETILGSEGKRLRVHRDPAPELQPRAISGVSLVTGRISYVDKI